MLDFNRDIIPYLNCNNEGLPNDANLKGVFYDKSVKHSKDLKEVFGIEYPTFLEKNRPRETESHKKYRKEIFKNVTIPFLNDAKKMVTATINASDYDQRWPNVEIKLPDPNLYLKKYSEEGIPKIGNIADWFWNNYPKQFVLDPNSGFLVLPFEQPTSENETYKPEPRLINSEDVIILKRGTFGVIRLPEKHYIEIGNKKIKEGRTLIFVDKDSYTICKQTKKITQKTNEQGKEITSFEWDILGLGFDFNGSPDLEPQMVFNPPLHYCNSMPLWRIGNEIIQVNGDGEELYESFVSPAIPFLQKALQRDSDLEIEVLHKVHAYEWFFAFKACNYKGCKNGVIQDYDENKHPVVKECPNCQGTGMPKSGLERIIISPENMKSFGDDPKSGNTPIPPGGFIPRDIQGLIEFRNEFIRNWEMAYSVINADFKTRVPLATSGTSKSFDRQEYYRDLANIARNAIVNGLERLYNYTDSFLYHNLADVKGVQLPQFTIPKDSFNLDTLPELIAEYEKLKLAGADAITLFGMEVKICIKKFGSSSTEKKRLDLKYICDPYYSVDEKKKREQLLYELYAWKNILKDDSEHTIKIANDIYFSLQYESIFQDIVKENENFYGLVFDKQVDLIRKARAEVNITELREFSDLKGIVLNPPVDAKNINQV